jgi:hypothetical protein
MGLKPAAHHRALIHALQGTAEGTIDRLAARLSQINLRLDAPGDRLARARNVLAVSHTTELATPRWHEDDLASRLLAEASTTSSGRGPPQDLERAKSLISLKPTDEQEIISSPVAGATAAAGRRRVDRRPPVQIKKRDRDFRNGTRHKQSAPTRGSEVGDGTMFEVRGQPGVSGAHASVRAEGSGAAAGGGGEAVAAGACDEKGRDENSGDGKSRDEKAAGPAAEGVSVDGGRARTRRWRSRGSGGGMS